MTQDYWKERASDFSGYYTSRAILSPKNFVSHFLNARTSLLFSLMDYDKDSTILDLGCGSGVHMKLLAGRCRHITGVDYSEQMISQAAKELEGIDRNKWKLQISDAQHLPFSDNSFDLIISMGLLDYVNSPYNVLSECHRVLKESGSIIFTMPKRPSPFFFLRTPIGNFIKKKIFNLPPISNTMTNAELKDLLSSTGFLPIDIRSVWAAMWILKATKSPNT